MVGFSRRGDSLAGLTSWVGMSVELALVGEVIH